MNYEQKYKNALKWARLVKDGRIDFDITAVEKVFPELAESEDEKIRKQIISFLKEFEHDHYRSLDFSSWLAWLKKQESVEEIVERCKTSWYNEGKIQGQIEGLSDDEKYQQGWHDAIERQGEQNPANKIELKFHVGDWIVNNGHSYLIAAIEDDRYLFEIGGYTHEQLNWEYIKNADKKYHLWTIEDAKPGDVLCYKDEISLFAHDIKNCTEQGTNFGGFVYHCCYDGKRLILDSLYSLTEQDKIDIHPATKEQRDILFSKMKESGYEWDADNKEIN